YGHLSTELDDAATVILADLVALAASLFETLEGVLAILLAILLLECLEVLGMLDPLQKEVSLAIGERIEKLEDLLLFLVEKRGRTRAPMELEEGRLHLGVELL